jgi:N6-adenosine-specific RNA methylase IME4
MSNNNIIKLEQATQMLAEIHSVDDAIQIIDLAEAARVYAQQVKLGLEAQNHAAEIKLRAQRRAGEILQQMEKAQGGQPYQSTGLSLKPVEEQPQTYDKLGISKYNAHVWQTLAAMPAEKFEQVVEETKSEDKELSTAALYREAKLYMAGDKPAAPPMPTGKYRIIYADPPWKYNFKLADFHYPTLSIDDLCALPVKQLADDNAVLFLWVTSPMLEDAFRVVHAWGFEYKTSFVWDKVKHNMGYYNSVRHEFLLVCTRGSCTPDNIKLFDSVQTIERGEHSEKPERFREIIDTIYTNGARIELFARHPADGWEVWGNEPAIIGGQG